MDQLDDLLARAHNVEVKTFGAEFEGGEHVTFELLSERDHPENGTIITSDSFDMIATVTLQFVKRGFAVQVRKVEEEYTCKIYTLPGCDLTGLSLTSVPEGESSLPILIASLDLPLPPDHP